MTMNHPTSKAVSLFLSLGLATSLAACGTTPPPAEDGGEEGGALPQESSPHALVEPTQTATLVANESTTPSLDAAKDDEKGESGEGYESDDDDYDDEAGEGYESDDDYDDDEAGEGYES
jgi:hypothetical protein